MEEEIFGTKSGSKTYLQSRKKTGIFPSVIMQIEMQICQVLYVLKYKNIVLWKPP